MKKIIKEADKKKGIVQITTIDERWYFQPGKNEGTGLPEYQFVPSSTWIAGYYPKGIGFYKWLAQKGWDEAEAIKQAAGDKGSKVHQAIDVLLNGKIVKITDKFLNPTTGQEEELTLEEYETILSFVEWWKERKPAIIAKEFVVFNEKEGYAGTVDCLARIGDKVYLIDYKTSQAIWPEYELQVSSYKHALNPQDFVGLGETEEINLMILQLGYKRNKNAWKESEIEDKFELFLHAKAIWANENGDEKPKQKDYPLEIQLNSDKNQKEKTNKKSKNLE